MNLRVEKLSFAYQPGQPVLRDVTLELASGRVTGLFGPNGSGKSTLLRCLNGSLLPQSGNVWLGELEVAKLTAREAARLVAVVSQDTPVSLPFTALEVVLLGRYAHGTLWHADSPEEIQLGRDCLERLDVAQVSDRPFDHLSGGERQRVIVARALAQDAPVLLWDEPASHLDIRHQIELYRLARDLASDGRTVVMVCHDLFLAPLFVDCAVLLKRGTVVSMGLPTEVLIRGNLLDSFGVDAALAWPDGGTIHLSISSPVRAVPKSGAGSGGPR